MAFAFLTEKNFEAGTNAEWSSETDTDSKLSVMHYSDLAAIPGLPAPYRGAYCAAIDLSKGTNDAYYQEDTAWDTAAGGTVHTRFMVWLSPTLTMANNDELAIFKLQSAGPVDEAAVVINYTTANGYRIGVGETSGSQFLGITLGQWHCVELAATIDSGGGNDGTLTMRLDGSAATAVTALDQGAITQARLGAVGIDAGTTKGWVLFDEVVADDARVYPFNERFPQDVLVTKSGHIFVGNGCIGNVTLLSGAATDNVVSLWDTDTANTNDAGSVKLELKNVTASDVVDPAGVPIVVQRGAYVTMTGTNPRALIKIDRASGYGSDGAVRQVGMHRTARPQNV